MASACSLESSTLHLIVISFFDRQGGTGDRTYEEVKIRCDRRHIIYAIYFCLFARRSGKYRRLKKKCEFE
jgi:hypothetical protein